MTILRALCSAILTIGFAAGCAARIDWTHPEKPREAMYADAKQCEEETRMISGPRARAQMRDACMESKGWR